jgi:hypothetical protein
MNKEHFLTVMASTKGATIATIETDTEVSGVAAKFKSMIIRKQSRASVMLFNGLNDADPYVNKVNKTSDNNEQTFVKSENYFNHSKECYSLVEHSKTGKPYLFALYNRVFDTVYTIGGKVVDKSEVVNYLTPSAAKTFFEDKSTIYNKLNDVYHSAIIRTISLENVVKLTANGQTV